jgi:rRNA-processing protein EBP2
MVTKSKLKMALASDKGVDFKKLNLKKKEKAARKEKAQKSSGKILEKKVEEEWEDLDENENGEGSDGKELSGSEEDVGGPMQASFPCSNQIDCSNLPQIDFEGIDESDSDSSAGENDQVQEEDEEDIPMSDLEDLDEEEKEDIIPYQRLTINNTIALTAALKRIALPISKIPFSEHQSLTTSAPVSIPDVSDDLNRELAFYAQSLESVKEARKLLKAEGVLFTRPTDYFAEMVKADEHMAKIKAKLIDEAASKKASAEARKQRDLKKFGKQVQVAKLQERDKERKQTLDKIKTLKRSTSPFPQTTICTPALLYNVLTP